MIRANITCSLLNVSGFRIHTTLLAWVRTARRSHVAISCRIICVLSCTAVRLDVVPKLNGSSWIHAFRTLYGELKWAYKLSGGVITMNDDGRKRTAVFSPRRPKSLGLVWGLAAMRPAPSPGPKKLWNFEARACIGLHKNLDFIIKNVRLVIRTPLRN